MTHLTRRKNDLTTAFLTVSTPSFASCRLDNLMLRTCPFHINLGASVKSEPRTMSLELAANTERSGTFDRFDLSVRRLGTARKIVHSAQNVLGIHKAQETPPPFFSKSAIASLTMNKQEVR